MVELTSTPCAPSLGSRIRGAPTATGKFLGRVRWLGDLSDKHPASGDEVIVANSFSAGHSLMIGHAGAIVSASGGPFSHTAFIARQLGVPAVVGLGESVAALKQGDEVLVDGTEGVVLRTLRGFARH
jgi:phosphohistidine swiveling domain-containing protein